MHLEIAMGQKSIPTKPFRYLNQELNHFGLCQWNWSSISHFQCK